MAKCNHLTPLPFKGLILRPSVKWPSGHLRPSGNYGHFNHLLTVLTDDFLQDVKERARTSVISCELNRRKLLLLASVLQM